jgi:hypothetical protein
MIPLEEFEGKANADAFTYLLQSVVDGGLNTLRVWGGGISFPLLFALLSSLFPTHLPLFLLKRSPMHTRSLPLGRDLNNKIYYLRYLLFCIVACVAVNTLFRSLRVEVVSFPCFLLFFFMLFYSFLFFFILFYSFLFFFLKFFFCFLPHFLICPLIKSTCSCMTYSTTHVTRWESSFTMI